MIRREGWGISHRELQCEPISVHYDFVARIGRLNMADGDCCDMTGCISFFKRMDQDVRRIETFSANRADTVYVKDDGGNWRAKQ